MNVKRIETFPTRWRWYIQSFKRKCHTEEFFCRRQKCRLAQRVDIRETTYLCLSPGSFWHHDWQLSMFSACRWWSSVIDKIICRDNGVIKKSLPFSNSHSLLRVTDKKKKTSMLVDQKLSQCEKNCWQLCHLCCKMVHQTGKDILPSTQGKCVQLYLTARGQLHQWGMVFNFHPYVWHLKLPDIFIGKRFPMLSTSLHYPLTTQQGLCWQHLVLHNLRTHLLSSDYR